MRFVALLLALVPAALGDLDPEHIPRPSVKGYSTITGVCDAAAGTIAGETYTGRAGTLKSCTKRCTDVANCKGLNFITDQNQCQLFQQTCETTSPVGKTMPTQNFYLKGEIACSTSTVGNEFYVSFMANRVAQPKNMSLEIWITQDRSVTPTTVTMEIDPSMVSSWNAPVNKQTIKVPFKQAVSTLIPFTWKASDIDNGVTLEKKALKLYSDTDFVLYGVNKEFFTADAFLGIPSRALGTRYVANCHWPPFYNCEFAFTPTTEDTTVTITLPRAGSTRIAGSWEKAPTNGQLATKCNIPYLGKVYSNGDTFKVNLGKFDVAQIQDPCDLTGTIIESDKPIAVWSGDSRVNVGDSPSRDHLVEELFSTDTWGTDCAAWPTPNRAATLVDTWVITAATDGTVVIVDSSEKDTVSYTLNAGESVRFPANSVTEWMRFSSDKKFQAAQYTHSAVDPKIPGDPSMTMCIPSDQFGFGYTFVTPTGVSSTYTNYLTIITTSGKQDGFVLDGNPLTGITWNKVPNSTLVGGFVLLDTSTKQQFRIEHSVKGSTFEAYIYGAGDRESIAYPTGACIKALGKCVTSKMFIADGKDNDCDGVIDEEVFDGIDNDLDGLIDEDCYAIKAVPQDRCPVVNVAAACNGGQLQLSCSDGVIKVIEAHFGRVGHAGETSCNVENPQDSCSGLDTNCGYSDISRTVSIQCDGQASCSLPSNQFNSGMNKCPACSLYANANYACLNQKEYSFGILSGQNRLASSFLAASTVDNSCPNNPGSRNSDLYSPPKSDFATSAIEAWRPAVCDKDSSWLQVDLGSTYAVGWYAISGCRRQDYWITQFGISYSTDGNKWTVIRETNGEIHRFDGNIDSVTDKVCTLFSYNIIARFMRIHPLAYNGYPCAHVDFGHNATFQGCPVQQVTNSNFAQGGNSGFGVTATITCNKGWATARAETTYTVTCGGDGKWTSDFRDCSKLLFCPDIPQIVGGYATALNNKPGAQVTYSCLGGRRLNGASSITCGDNGLWSADPPTCEQL